MARMTAQAAGSKIVEKLLLQRRKGVHGLMQATGLTHGQTWNGINWLRDNATQLGGNLIAFDHDTREYVIGDLQAVRKWVDREFSGDMMTRARRRETALRAVYKRSGDRADEVAARSAGDVVTSLDRVGADLRAAIAQYQQQNQKQRKQPKGNGTKA